MINQAPIITTERLIHLLLVIAIALAIFSQVPAIAEKLQAKLTEAITVDANKAKL